MNHLSRRAPGFSLLEVLIAVLVLAIGLLSMGALYVRSLQSVSESYMLTNANSFANQVATQMKFMSETQLDNLVDDFDLSTTEVDLLNYLNNSNLNVDTGVFQHLVDVRMDVQRDTTNIKLYQIIIAWKAFQVSQVSGSVTSSRDAGGCVPNDIADEFSCFKTYVHIQ